MRSEADIWAALGEVIHPTYGMSLVTLHMVQAIRITPDCIEVDLVMNCPGCPAGKVALAKAREVVNSLCASVRQRVAISLLPQVWNPPGKHLSERSNHVMGVA